MNYTHVHMPRQSTVIGFWKGCFVLIHSQVCCGSVLWMRCSRSRGETSDIILLNESLRFIQNVASCYALCLTKESVNTATLVHAPACVRVCVCVRACVHAYACVCATHGGLSDTSALEIRSRGGSGFNSLPVRSPDFEKRWAIPLSACWSRFVYLCLWENKRRQMPKAPSLLHHSVFTFTFCL